uniref:PDZ domain-containing protein n=1 Tax=Heterorhabditis bacteriophora TaxID=37862 RepID=A0A1I7WX36_HETBA
MLFSFYTISFVGKARLVLLWVNNHYNDFETNDEMAKLLERFEGALERDGMHSQQSLLNIACSVKARPRTVMYTRANKDDILHFTIQGGKESNFGIFISEVKYIVKCMLIVQPDSPAERAGLKRGDEVLEINGQSMKYLSLARAVEITKTNLSLTLLLKSNVLGFKDMIGKVERDISKSAKNKAMASVLNQSRNSMPSVIPVKAPKTLKLNGTKTSMMDKLMTILKSTKDGEDFTDEARAMSSELRPSRSNPDITSISHYYGPVKSECPEHVLKIYRYILLIRVYLQFILRYYLKNNNRSEPLVPDDMAPDIIKEAQAQLLMLNAQYDTFNNNNRLLRMKDMN